MLEALKRQPLAVAQRVAKSVFARRVAATFVTSIFSLALSVVSAVIVARWLGPAGRGTVALAILLPTMLQMFLGGGVGIANCYYAAGGRIQVSRLAANSVTFAGLAAGAGFVLTGCLMATGLLEWIIPGVPLSLFALSMLILPASLLCDYFRGILLGLNRFGAVNLMSVLQGLVAVPLTLVLVVWLLVGPGGPVAATAAAFTIVAVAGAALLWREGGPFGAGWDAGAARATVGYGLKGYVGNLMQYFNYRLDFFLVNFFLGAAAAGIYAVAVQLTELLWHFPNAVGTVIFPKAASSNPEVMNRFTPRVVAVTLLLTLAGGALLAVIGRVVIFVLFSEAFLDAYLPMLWLLPGVILLSGAKVLGGEIAGRGYPHYNSMITGASLVVTIAADLTLIPNLGVIGAAMASSLAYSLTLLLTVACFYRLSRGGPAPPPQSALALAPDFVATGMSDATLQDSGAGGIGPTAFR